jgi:hypothetical protein
MTVSSRLSLFRAGALLTVRESRRVVTRDASAVEQGDGKYA